MCIPCVCQDSSLFPFYHVHCNFSLVRRILVFSLPLFSIHCAKPSYYCYKHIYCCLHSTISKIQPKPHVFVLYTLWLIKLSQQLIFHCFTELKLEKSIWGIIMRKWISLQIVHYQWRLQSYSRQWKSSKLTTIYQHILEKSQIKFKQW